MMKYSGILLFAILSVVFISSVPFSSAAEKYEEGGITWCKDYEIAKKEAKGSMKLIFFFFHHPRCSGCKKIISDTLPDERVKNILETEFIPLTYLVTEAKDIAQQYKVDWTPTFIIADEKGQEQYRWVGFLPPDEFLAQITLSSGHVAFKKGAFDQAQLYFKKVLMDFHRSEFAPEARYFLGVSQYKSTHEPSYLKKTWNDMKARYPGNNWTKKASAWEE